MQRMKKSKRMEYDLKWSKMTSLKMTTCMQTLKGRKE